MEFFRKIIEAIQNFIEAIFFSSSPEYQRKKQLKLILSEIKQVHPPIYRPNKILLPGLPALLYQLYGFTQPLRQILDKTIDSPDMRISNTCYDSLLEEILPEFQKRDKADFAFPLRCQELENLLSEEREKKMQDQLSRFKEFLKCFESEQFLEKNRQLQNLIIFSDLCHFHFIDFFARFDSQFLNISNKPLPPPAFKEVHATEVLPLLLDLNYILKNLSLNEALVYNLAELAVRSGEEHSVDPQGFVGKNIRALANILEKKLTPTTIPNLLRLIKDDPAFSDRTPEFHLNPLNEYIKRQVSKFNADSSRIMKVFQEQKINDLVIAMFGEVPLIQLYGYNDTVSDMVQNVAPVAFEWVRPLEVIATFTQVYFDGRYKPFLREVLIEGHFLNKQFNDQFSSVYYFCESISDKISNFESLFKENGQCSLQTVETMIEDSELGKDCSAKLTKLTDEANAQAKYLVQKMANQYEELFKYINLLLDDSKKSLPECVSNIKALATANKNKDSFNHIQNDLHVFARFLEIMKNFAILGTDEGMSFNSGT